MTDEQINRELDELEARVLTFPRPLSDDAAADLYAARASELRKQALIREAIRLTCLGILGGSVAAVLAVLFCMAMGWA